LAGARACPEERSPSTCWVAAPGRLGSRCPEPLIHLAQRGAPAERHAEYGGGDVPTDGPERADELASKAAEAALRAVEDNG